MLRHQATRYMQNHEDNPDLAKLQDWTRDFDCVSHHNMHWRFDGKYLINELGTYLARQKMDNEKWTSIHGKQAYWVHLNFPKTGKLKNADFNSKRLFWEYDPATNLLGYPHDSIPCYLTRWCEDDQNGGRDCSWRQLAKPKTTKTKEEKEQRFWLDYQGAFQSRFLILTFLIQCRSSSMLEAVATKAGRVPVRDGVMAT